MNRKQQDALETITNFALYFTSDENSRERLIEVAHEYVEQDHVLTTEDSTSIEWCIDDVRGIREDLDDDQAMEVLDFVAGITWETLQYAADHLFPRESLEVELLP